MKSNAANVRKSLEVELQKKRAIAAQLEKLPALKEAADKAATALGSLSRVAPVNLDALRRRQLSEFLDALAKAQS